MRSIPKIRKNLYLSLTAWRQIRILQAIMSKGERISEREVEIKPRKLDVNGRDVVIVDDIISTGGTMVEAIKVIKKEGARKVIVA